MLPSVGGGSTLRGFSSRRFRDRNSLLLQAEWRIMVNRFLDTAVFYDAGKVAARTSDLDLNGLKSDFGFGFRFHGPFATPLRIEVARSREGLRLVFATSADLLRLPAMSPSSFASRARRASRLIRCWLAALGMFASAVSTQGRTSTRTIRSRANRSPRTRRRRSPTTSGRCTR